MKSAPVLVLLALLFTALPARAQINAPGLSLNRNDLGPISLPFTGGQAAIKGQKATPAPYTVRGYLTAVVGYRNAAPLCASYCFYSTSKKNVLGATRIPSFASGNVYVGAPGGLVGFAGSLFEPDQIQRKGNAKETRTKLKQKNYVGIRFRTAGTPGNAYALAAVDGCKAQADLRLEFGVSSRSKFKVNCRKGALDDLLDGIPQLGPDQSDLEAFLQHKGLKKKAAFEVERVIIVP